MYEFKATHAIPLTDLPLPSDPKEENKVVVIIEQPDLAEVETISHTQDTSSLKSCFPLTCCLPRQVSKEVNNLHSEGEEPPNAEPTPPKEVLVLVEREQRLTQCCNLASCLSFTGGQPRESKEEEATLNLEENPPEITDENEHKASSSSFISCCSCFLLMRQASKDAQRSPSESEEEPPITREIKEPSDIPPPKEILVSVERERPTSCCNLASCLCINSCRPRKISEETTASNLEDLTENPPENLPESSDTIETERKTRSISCCLCFPLLNRDVESRHSEGKEEPLDILDAIPDAMTKEPIDDIPTKEISISVPTKEISISVEEEQPTRSCCNLVSCLSIFNRQRRQTNEETAASNLEDLTAENPPKPHPPEDTDTSQTEQKTRPSSFFSRCCCQSLDESPEGADDEEPEPEQAIPVPQTNREQVIELRKEIVSTVFYEKVEELTVEIESGPAEYSCCQCCGQCIGSCFSEYSCSCNCSNISSLFPFGRRNRQPGPQQSRTPKRKLMNEKLLRARDKGSSILSTIIDKFFENWKTLLFLLWVIPEFIFGIIGFFSSVATLSLDQNRAFNILQFVLIFIGTILAVIDFVGNTYSACKASKMCAKCKNRKATSSCQQPKCCQTRACSWFVKGAKYFRAVLTELILYPALICDLFEVTTGNAFEPKTAGDRLGVFLFVISCIYFVLYVYVARIVVLCGMIWNINTVRSLDEKDSQIVGPGGYDTEIRKSANRYQVGFTVHVILQMLAQVLMFIAIGAKIRYDNRHFYEPNNQDNTIYVSSYLWYMIVAGFAVPFMGIFSFFIVAFYWTQEFPIGIFTDFLQMTAFGPEEIVKPHKMGVEDKRGKAIELLNKFKANFDEYRNVRAHEKFAYPFKSPGMVVFCTVYLTLQLAFILCAGLAMDETGAVGVQILNGGGWAVYYILAIIVGVIANVYAFLVTGFWIAVVVMVLLVIAMIIAMVVLVVGGFILLACLSGSGSSSDRRRRY